MYCRLSGALERRLKAVESRMSVVPVIEISSRDLLVDSLRAIKRDIEGIQQLTENFTAQVKEGGDDLVAIEINSKSALLGSAQAKQELEKSIMARRNVWTT